MTKTVTFLGEANACFVSFTLADQLRNTIQYNFCTLINSGLLQNGGGQGTTDRLNKGGTLTNFGSVTGTGMYLKTACQTINNGNPEPNIDRDLGRSPERDRHDHRRCDHREWGYRESSSSSAPCWPFSLDNDDGSPPPHLIALKPVKKSWATSHYPMCS